ncbi:DNA mismatch repair protein MutS [Aquisphaera giovannonii]|uniref:DNA mismatch repair protein MutS n=1 Tax=Aquisphaera giovannonii TaxID=406548 RepID=A0A5B9WDU8_9BACT|nr:DNA mismatch repair protein MutS [Aquisphaera giovannonii]QEH38245.1 DNA mismatch repair protein MutS [Aquisphaera giovannonii]
MSDPSLTPMMQQYRELKARDPDALLLFRMGDFYEMFGEDAERASALLGIALTTRDRDKGDAAVPMAGFPHPALESYLARIVQAGLRAAVCEQVEDAKLAKGLVRRDVVRVVTPGTLTDDALLDPKSPNYLAAVVESGNKLGLAWVELSTGKFSLSGLLRHELADEMARLNPAETLVSELSADAPWLKGLRANAGLAVTIRPSWDFQPEEARKTLHDQFRTATLEGFGVDDRALEVQAAGALVAYLRETQKSSLGHIVRLTPYRRAETLSLDEMTRRSLELTRTLREGKREGSLLHVIDRTVTPMGARLLADYLTSPLTSIDLIRERSAAVEELVGDASLRGDLREKLGEAYDLERLAARVATGRATPRDLAALARTLALLPAIKARLTARRSPRLAQLEAAIELCPEVRASIEGALVSDPPLSVKEGGLIRPGYHPELDRLRTVSRDGKSWITRYQAEQVQRTGIPGLKIGFNQVFGYYIEVTHAQASRGEIPNDYIRKQTVKNAERYYTAELKEFENEVRNADERANALEYELFAALRDRVSADAPRLIQAGSVLAQVDVLASFAELAARQGYCRPDLSVDPVFEVEAGRHPVLDAVMRPGDFVPNDVALHPDAGMILLITGPNMAGKSTYIRQVALTSILAQIGGFVPARRARIGVVDRLFARVGATDELSRGQSTFMVEMTETANILNNATSRSLVILDEIGRGTSTFDGISLAWAITEHIHDNVGCRTLFATHYHELVELEKTKPRLRNANVAVSEHDGEIVFLHRINAGGADQSYGIHVARLAGVPSPVLDRAREILAFLEKQHGPDPGLPEGPIRRKVKTGRALSGSLFAALPDPLLEELRHVDVVGLQPDQALNLLRRLKELAE